VVLQKVDATMGKMTYIPSKEKEGMSCNRNPTYIASNWKGNIDGNSSPDADGSLSYEGSRSNIFLPINIFSNGLSGLEAISKYLKEASKRRYCEIARLLNRDDRTIWDAYHNAKQKNSQMLVAEEFEEAGIYVPLDIFNNRSLSILENLTAYLKENLNLRYCQIASLLNKDARTIWTVYNRVKKKRKNGRN
jgi:neutral trehalase